MKACLLFIFITLPLFCPSQNRGNVWCFGDSAGIDFNNLNNPVPIITSLRTRGSSASIADSSGNLLFYSNSRANFPGDYSTILYNRLNNPMLNGDSIIGEGWYNEIIIIPMPNNDSLYYLFSISTALGPGGIYYSVINMNADSGNGEVIIKNVLLQSYTNVDCLSSVKHGNGRDWWLLFRRYDGTNATTNNQFFSYLILPSGISNFQIQNVGSMLNTALGQLKFNRDGNKIAFCSFKGTLEIFDFNRCNVIISNPQLIYLENSGSPFPSRISCEFSSNSEFLYVCNNPDSSFIFQYDLDAPNIALSESLIWNIPQELQKYSGGHLKLAPNNKIYFSSAYYNGFFPYPYPDSVFNNYNMNLGVINSPDSLGSACDFQPYSFFLGGKRTYWGLPNNPDYDLGPLVGSPCDTLVGVNDLSINNSISPELFVYYDIGWQAAFINANSLKDRNYRLSIYDLLGKEIFIESGKIHSSYFTKNLDCSSFSKGMYLVVFQTDEEKLVKRFVRE